MNLFQKILIRLPQLFRKSQRINKTRKLKLFKKSDKQRWADENNLHANWDERSRKLAEMIAPRSVVLEFGAGRLEFQHFLAEGCTYIPSDIVARNEQTFVCDLNDKTLPDFPDHQVAVFSGVLEYIFNLERLIQKLAANQSKIVCSYACLQNPTEKKYRLEQGWVNALTKEQFLKLFTKEGYRLIAEEEWDKQHLFSFEP